MRPLSLALLAALAAPPLAALSLTSLEPTGVVQVDPAETGSTRSLTLRGSGITPGANAGEDVARVRFQMRRAGGEWTTPRSAGGGVTSNQWTFGVWSSEWFAVPGTLEVRLLVDGRPTNALPIAVAFAPTTPPEITALAPTQLPLGSSSEGSYLFYVRGLRYSDPLRVSVDGSEASFARVMVDSGYALVYLPAALRGRSGRYPVVVRTRAGASLPAYVEVAGPPRVAALEPGEVVKEKAGTGSSVRVRVRFEGAAPTSIRVGSDSLGWVSSPPQNWADSPVAVWVEVPMSMVNRAGFGHPQAIQIVLANPGGSSTGTLTARSDGSTLQLRPGVGAPATVARPGAVSRPPPVNTPIVRPPRP
jgi:hypothetical protein